MSEPAKPAPEIDVRYVAHLARMHLTDQEVAELSGQIGDIVGYFHQLDALDVSGIEPMAHTTPAGDLKAWRLRRRRNRGSRRRGRPR